MSQIGQVQVNFNNPLLINSFEQLPKALIIGVSQRGPIYKVVEIDNLTDFLIAFGQPTNKYEFDFFEAVKSTVNSGGIALCYRIPYTDAKDFSKPMEFFIVDHPQERLNYNLKFRDFETNIEYVLRVRIENGKERLYLIRCTDPTAILVDWIVIRGDNMFYKLYVSGGKLLTDETEETEDAFTEFYVLNEEETESYYIDFHNNDVTAAKVGLYLYEGDDDSDDKINFDVIYKSSKYIDFVYDEGVKLTFNLINDFNSALIIKDKNNNTHIDIDSDDTEISADSICYTGLKSDIDYSQILGVFPIFFGPRDAENLRNLNYKDLYLFDKSEYSNRIDIFNTYVCQSNNSDEPYKINTEIISDNIFAEFERDTHFKHDWLEKEIAKLIDKYIPQDLESCSNTLGVAFFGIYLNDEHKLDYALLETYYGLIGYSNNNFSNLEDLINKNSKFFRVLIEGEIRKEHYVRALSRDSFIEEKTKWIVPFFAPTPYNGPRNLIDMDSIFAETPSCKYDFPYSYSISQLFDKLEKTEFLNSVPFDYILAPGLVDIMMLKPIDNLVANLSLNSKVQYNDYQVNLLDNVYDEKNSYSNIKSFYRFISLGTRFGDKGTIAFIDIPERFNEYFNSGLKKCYTDKDISELLSILKQILPQLKGSGSEIYDRTYPLYNYQYADKDARLTRYHRFRPLRKFEIVPGSSEAVGAYISSQYLDNFDPIAGPRSSELFIRCHKALSDLSNPQFFKLLFDLYGISSIINNKDNNTFPVQQTTWKNSFSVLKQLHAFRIYVAIRRRAYGIIKSFIYETNTQLTRENLKTQLEDLLYKFKEKHYIAETSSVRVWADIPDIEQHQLHVELIVGIYGALVKIIINMNLQDMKIEVVS